MNPAIDSSDGYRQRLFEEHILLRFTTLEPVSRRLRITFGRARAGTKGTIVLGLYYIRCACRGVRCLWQVVIFFFVGDYYSGFDCG